MITISKRAVNKLLRVGYVTIKSRGHKRFTIGLKGNKVDVHMKIAKLEEKLEKLKKKL